MTASVKILTTSTIDSSPSILLISPNGARILINCGEGCQRSFLESSSVGASNGNGVGNGNGADNGADNGDNKSSDNQQTSGGDKVRSVNQICLTHVGYDATGGLPGLILTSADASAASNANSVNTDTVTADSNDNGNVNNNGNTAKNNGTGKRSNGSTNNNNNTSKNNSEEGQIKDEEINPKKKSKYNNDIEKSKNKNKNKDIVGSLQIIGPTGTKQFIHTLRHFMRRDNFHLNISEGQFLSKAKAGDGVVTLKKKKGKKKKNANNKDAGQDEGHQQQQPKMGLFGIQSIPLKRKIQILKSSHENNNSNDGEQQQQQQEQEQEHEATINVSSYIFTTSPIPGKFQIKKAKELLIPPGPLYAQLKGGKTISFPHPSKSGEEVTVQPSQVLEGGSEGVAIALIYCPDEFVLNQICNESVSDINNGDDDNDGDIDGNNGDGGGNNKLLDSLFKFKTCSLSERKENGKNNDANEKEDKVILEVMIHYTPTSIFKSEKYQRLLREFDTNVQHITIHPMEEKEEYQDSYSSSKSDNININVSMSGGNEEVDGSPFQSAVLGAMTRGLIHQEIYTSPFPIKKDNEQLSTTKGSSNETTTNNDVKNEESHPASSDLNIIRARGQMEYTLIPLAKKGLNKSSMRSENDKFGITTKEHANIHSTVNESGALKEAKRILDDYSDQNKSPAEVDIDHKDASTSMIESLENNSLHDKGELIFTGTGSAIPCKHRNVTGMYLQMDNGNGILLDVGEGTVGQLIRSWKSNIPQDQNVGEYIRKKLLNIKAIWISHPHADHHLGIVRFLAERNALLVKLRESNLGETIEEDPVVLMASTSLLYFLSEYSRVDPTIAGGYIAVDCRDTIPNKTHPLGQRLNQSLGITWCASVPVAHCWNSYALVLDGTSFGRVVYSGDCRPSDRLVDVGTGADLLIHEATFEDGMEEEAVLKRHSTVGEAISVGKRMKVKNLILTHFSQRYPRIPPLQKEGDSADFPIAIAFDFMKVNIDNIAIAAKLTPALRLLYPDTEENNIPLDIDPTKPTAKETLSIPGAFANQTSCILK